MNVIGNHSAECIFLHKQGMEVQMKNWKYDETILNSKTTQVVVLWKRTRLKTHLSSFFLLIPVWFSIIKIFNFCCIFLFICNLTWKYKNRTFQAYIVINLNLNKCKSKAHSDLNGKTKSYKIKVETHLSLYYSP